MKCPQNEQAAQFLKASHADQPDVMSASNCASIRTMECQLAQHLYHASPQTSQLWSGPPLRLARVKCYPQMSSSFNTPQCAR